tara:strand:- start:3185 stop:3487 length:303 start_codon:yes stop_codon:yes gene_type:complete
MKKFIIVIIFFLFIISTALTKNSTKKIEEKIYEKRENLAVLNDKYDLVLLEFDYLSSSEQIQKKIDEYFNDEFFPIEISKLQIIKTDRNQITFQNYIYKN